VPVSHDDFAGIYLPVLYLDKVIPIVAGREIWDSPRLKLRSKCPTGAEP
jgi:acetoacetate decarboxylase